MHPDNKGSNKVNVKNIDSANNIPCSFHTWNPFIRFGKAYTYWKNYEGGEDIWYMPWTLDVLCMCGIWTLYMDFVKSFGLCGKYNFRRDIFCELGLAYEQHHTDTNC